MKNKVASLLILGLTACATGQRLKPYSPAEPGTSALVVYESNRWACHLYLQPLGSSDPARELSIELPSEMQSTWVRAEPGSYWVDRINCGAGTTVQDFFPGDKKGFIQVQPDKVNFIGAYLMREEPKPGSSHGKTVRIGTLDFDKWQAGLSAALQKLGSEKEKLVSAFSGQEISEDMLNRPNKFQLVFNNRVTGAGANAALEDYRQRVLPQLDSCYHDEQKRNPLILGHFEMTAEYKGKNKPEVKLLTSKGHTLSQAMIDCLSNAFKSYTWPSKSAQLIVDAVGD